jgi:hypothetical protein
VAEEEVDSPARRQRIAVEAVVVEVQASQDFSALPVWFLITFMFRSAAAV